MTLSLHFLSVSWRGPAAADGAENRDDVEHSESHLIIMVPLKPFHFTSGMISSDFNLFRATAASNEVSKVPPRIAA